MVEQCRLSRTQKAGDYGGGNSVIGWNLCQQVRVLAGSSGGGRSRGREPAVGSGDFDGDKFGVS